MYKNNLQIAHYASPVEALLSIDIAVNTVDTAYVHIITIPLTSSLVPLECLISLLYVLLFS